MFLFLNTRADIFNNQGKFIKADSLYNQSYEIAKLHHDSTDSRLIGLLADWGNNARLMNDYQKSLSLFERAYHYQSKFNNTDNELRKKLIHNLINTHRAAGNVAKADSLAKAIAK
jgi:tetratricopeptide (TPR) repeat protein